MKQKLLLVCESFGGGTFSYLCELCRALEGEYKIYIAHSMRPETPENFKSKFAPDVEFIRLENFGREIEPKRELKAIRELRRVVREVEPDVIHLHSTKAGVIGRLGLNSRKYRIFYTPHGYSFLMHGAGKAKRGVYLMIEKLCSIGRATTISCSPAEDRVTKKLTKKAECICNGINTASLSRFLGGSTENEVKTVCSISRICLHKKPELFNRIALALPELRFIWIGDGPERELLTAPNIEVTGWVDRMRAMEIAAGADAFLLTSHSEGLSMSLLEAMYLGKLCVVSDVIGNNDVIRNGENGYLCTAEEEYVAALCALTDDSRADEVRAMCECAHNEVLEKYNTDVMKQNYLAVYRQLR